MGFRIESTTRNSTVGALDEAHRSYPRFARSLARFDSTNHDELGSLRAISTPSPPERTFEWAVLHYDDLLRKLAD